MNNSPAAKQQSKEARIPKYLARDHPSLATLDADIQKQWQWASALRTHQSLGIIAQLVGEDALIHAGTGSGKTAIAAGPHAHPSSKGKVTIMALSPLIALQEEQVDTFKDEFGLEAFAVNSSVQGGIARETMAKICEGTWQIILISPEMLLSKRFVSKVLRNNDFRSRILSVVVDEAHVVSHWGADFRKKYGELGIIRALLPPGIPIVAMSATLPTRVR
ncbi:P-loop containing nucleoside triphosphate hydrolase protein [Mycena floridula]|nr:P-loop containing nucleoside triphosphate hydrolase protein [Mycena floridula]